MPLAHFITFSTYGTWLHGADKGEGSVDRDHNVYGSEFIPADKDREEYAGHRMTELPYVLHETARRVVCDAIVAICNEKGWKLEAVHVRTNHVHTVVSADRDPERTMNDFKARASRELNKLGVDSQIKRWTRHGSTRHLYTELSVAEAIVYVLDEQGPKMAVYDPRKK